MQHLVEQGLQPAPYPLLQGVEISVGFGRRKPDRLDAQACEVDHEGALVHLGYMGGANSWTLHEPSFLKAELHRIGVVAIENHHRSRLGRPKQPRASPQNPHC
jgi:hypothetical protein